MRSVPSVKRSTPVDLHPLDTMPISGRIALTFNMKGKNRSTANGRLIHAPFLPKNFTERMPVFQDRVDSLAGRAYLEIRNKILKGDLAVGEALSRRALAAELGISVPPITEALQRLEREGLLESKPRVGTRVRVPTPRDVEDRSLLREALETQAARLFGLYVALLVPAIAECARCHALRDAIEKEQVLIFNCLYDTAVQRRNLASDHHARLTDALARGTPAQADAAMRQHIRTGLKEVLKGMKLLDRNGSGWRHKKRTGSSAR